MSYVVPTKRLSPNKRFDQVFDDYHEFYKLGVVYFRGKLLEDFRNDSDDLILNFICGGASPYEFNFTRDGLIVTGYFCYARVEPKSKEKIEGLYNKLFKRALKI